MYRGKWTPAQNALIIGVLPEFRHRVSSGQTQRSAALLLANHLISHNAPFQFLNNRINNVKSPDNTIAQHIIRMNKIAKGQHPSRRAMPHEMPWFNVYP